MSTGATTVRQYPIFCHLGDLLPGTPWLFDVTSTPWHALQPTPYPLRDLDGIIAVQLFPVLSFQFEDCFCGRWCFRARYGLLVDRRDFGSGGRRLRGRGGG